MLFDSFNLYSPSLALSGVVEQYWELHSSEYSTNFLNPDGKIGLIFNLGDDFYLDDMLLGFGAYFDNTFTQTRRVSTGGNTHAIGVRFKTAGLSRILPFSIFELRRATLSLDKKLVSLEDVNPNTTHLVDQLAQSSTASERIQIIESWISSCLNRSHNSIALVTHATAILDRDNFSVHELGRALNVSERTLERYFRDKLGMSAKEYLRVSRVKRSLPNLRNPNLSLSDIATDLGFFDQSHFSRQFKSSLGITPGQYRKLTKEANQRK